MQGLLATAAVFHTSMNGSPSLERKLDNSVTVYDSPDTSTQIEAVVHSHSQLWKDHGNVVDLSEKK